MDIKAFIQEKIHQPKYAIPALVYIPILGLGYFVINMFTSEIPEKQEGESTEYLNNKLPDANIKGDGIGNKYDAMKDSYGLIENETAVDNAGEDSIKKEETIYDTKGKYDNEKDVVNREAGAIQKKDESSEAMQNLQNIQRQVIAQRNRRYGRDESSDDEELRTLQQRLAQAKQDESDEQQRQKRLAKERDQVASDMNNQVEKARKQYEGKQTADTKIVEHKDAVREIKEDQEIVEVAKKKKHVESNYFNTIASKKDDSNLIKAIIDENVKASDGSRIRLRLLDDLEAGDMTIPKGTYLYANMTGFSGKRVKGQVQSVLIKDQLVRVNLSIYDTDGLEGLYIPESTFREVSKDIGSSAFSSGGSSLFSGTSGGSNLAQMASQALQSSYTKMTSAISKAIRKNRAKLKYGTFVYLINSKSTNNGNKKKTEK